jgi:hypothetical protein
MKDNRISPIEKGIRVFDLSNPEKFDAYDRLYIGDDSCERLVPESTKLEAILMYARKNNKRISLLTSYYTDKGLKNLKIILGILNNSGSDIEVVINDIGVLKLLNSEYKNIIPVYGALSSSSFLHPYANFKSGCQGISSSERHLLAKEVFDFLIKNNFKRVEFDNITSIFLLADSFISKGINVSFHYPFTFLTSTRRCLFASRKSISSKFALLGCNKECLNYRLILVNRNLGHKIFVRGTAQYMRKKAKNNLSDICRDHGVDRLIRSKA